MVFSSLLFLFAFLPILLIVYYLCPSQGKNLVLLLGSILFYAWGEPVYVILMLINVLFNYVIGNDIGSHLDDKKYCRINLIFGIFVNLSILFYFKYVGFFLSILHISYSAPALPIGISFYTFQTLSYLVDVYLKKVKPQKSIIQFGVYVTMFPQLIAGPIVRYIDIESQLKHRNITLDKAGTGAARFTRGLAKKVILANHLGKLAVIMQSMPSSQRTMTAAWIGAIAYTMQIYFDFSGYSDMAIGLGKLLGFEFQENFDYPYTSKSITEFWRRWHISLGTWFREYVYIPLGGNRVNTAKHIRNIMVVWMLTGLWHGAAWNFIFWGLYYGILLLCEKYFWGKWIHSAPVAIQGLYTMILVIIGWVFFMSNTLTDAVLYLRTMFLPVGGIINATTIYYIGCYGILLIIGIICCLPLLHYQFLKLVFQWPVLAACVDCLLIVVSTAYLVFDTYNPFLYFRF